MAIDSATSCSGLHIDRGQLKTALETHQLRMWYQPVIHLNTGAVAGAEALIRWVLPDGRLLLPESFIPLARETGLLSEITHWLVEELFAELGAWLHRHSTLCISINVEPEDFLNTDLLQKLSTQCLRYQISPRQIALEMTENSAIDPRAIAEVMTQYRAAGHPLYLDDFGSGYANFSYLQALTFDVLKIDKTLVDPLPGQCLLPQIISLARALSLEPLVEGVETAAQVSWLKDNDVRYAQGWAFSKALPCRAFIHWCEARGIMPDADRGGADSVQRHHLR